MGAKMPNPCPGGPKPRPSPPPPPRRWNLSSFVNVAASRPKPVNPSDDVLLSQAREILVLLANAQSVQEILLAQDQADTFLKLWGTDEGAPIGLLRA